MEAALLTAVRTRLTLAATAPCTAHPAGHAVQKTGQDEELDYALGAADDELLAAIERRTARTDSPPAPPAGSGTPDPEKSRKSSRRRKPFHGQNSQVVQREKRIRLHLRRRPTRPLLSSCTAARSTWTQTEPLETGMRVELSSGNLCKAGDRISDRHPASCRRPQLNSPANVFAPAVLRIAVPAQESTHSRHADW
jgi:hypothetical protein